MLPEQVEIQYLQYAAAHPAYGVAEADSHGRIVDESGHEVEVDLADQDKGQQHDDHRTDGISPAPQGSGQDLVHTVEEHEEDVDVDEGHTGLDDGFISGEQTHGSIGKTKEQSGDGACNGQAHENGRDRSVDGPFFIVGAHVLGHEGGGSHGHGKDWQHDELVQLVVAAPACHAAGAEMVDVTLDKNV